MTVQITTSMISSMSRLILGALFHIQPEKNTFLQSFTLSELGKGTALGILHEKEAFSSTPAFLVPREVLPMIPVT